MAWTDDEIKLLKADASFLDQYRDKSGPPGYHAEFAGLDVPDYIEPLTADPTIADVFWSPDKDSDKYVYLEDLLENAPVIDYSLCNQDDVKLIGVASWQLKDDGFLNGATTFTSLTLENPAKKSVSFNPGKFYDTSLGGFYNASEEIPKYTAQYPFADDKCKGIAFYHYDISGEDYRKEEANDRPVRKHALDHSYDHIDLMGSLFIGHDSHPWGQSYNNQTGNDNQGNTLVDRDWEYYSHPQWARTYAKDIVSKFSDNNPANDSENYLGGSGVFKHTKLITVNKELIIHEGREQIIKIEEDKVTIDNAAKIDDAHELDIYTPNCCWERDPNPRWSGYGNVAMEECEYCYKWLSKSVERTREGYNKFKFTRLWHQGESVGNPCDNPANRNPDGTLKYGFVSTNNNDSCWSFVEEWEDPTDPYVGYPTRIFRVKNREPYLN